MGKDFIIVESPTKAKTLNKFLKGKYYISASMGHIRDLPTKKLGVEIKGDNFIPEYVVSPRGRKTYKQLKAFAKKSDRIFLASDPDREGEAIAWHLYELLKGINSNIQRIEFHEITKKAIVEAINKSGSIDLNRVDAQQARRILDRLMGYKLSPILWKVIDKGLSAGRVQSVALRIICEKETKIDNFKPEEYWKVLVYLITDSKDVIEFELVKINNKKSKIVNKEEVEKICSLLEKADYKIKSIVKKKQLKKPIPPLITSKLQQLASNKYNFSTSKTMLIAQQLYEGIAVTDTETLGLITYMRTDSIRVSDESKEMAINYIKKNIGEDYLSSTKNKFKQKTKNVQDAHEAIRPTYVDYSPEKIKKRLTPDQYKLYNLIWSVFIASQMRPAEFDNTVILVDAETILLEQKEAFKNLMVI